MSEPKEDPILKYLQFGEESWLARLFSGRGVRIFGGRGVEIEKSYFEGNPLFSAAAQSISNVGVANHFDHPISNIDESNEVDDPDDFISKLFLNYKIQFKGVRAEEKFLVISAGTDFLIISPLRYWSYLDGTHSSGHTKKIKVESFYYEASVILPNPEDEIIGEAWEHTTKSGERDLRYRENRKVYSVHRYGVMLRLQNKSKWQLGRLTQDISKELCTGFLRLTGADGEFDEDSDKNETSEKEAWNDVLGLSPGASEQEIKCAYREKIKLYHPDRVSGLGDKLKIVAEQEAKKINAAKEEGLARQTTRRKTG
jgi:hypothetical protein